MYAEFPRHWSIAAATGTLEGGVELRAEVGNALKATDHLPCPAHLLGMCLRVAVFHVKHCARSKIAMFHVKH